MPASLNAVQLNLDWSGADDDTRTTGYNISDRISVVSATFNKTSTCSFVDGCQEYCTRGHMRESDDAILIGARWDALTGDGRDYHGDLYELRVYNRSMGPTELAAITSSLVRSWKVSTHEADCSARPLPRHNCGLINQVRGLGQPGKPSAARLTKFVETAPKATLAVSLASTALSFGAAMMARCEGIVNESVPKLRSFAADEASINMLATTAASALAGLEYHLAHVVAKDSGDASKA